ncbi:MAG: PAS domain S-box protein, partial [Aliifodinibius sp.]|nr:PAS domain S-box protein [Fodinibius sp.]NIV13876.1 PAS domain S-box protein [Fodinibius sp.]NIY27628.1 PAS domain S-box protein [Fodinibius sp.]
MLHLKRNYSKNKPQRAALKLAVIYALIAGAYILLSDRLVESLTENAHTLTKLQTIKGWLFIIGTAVILFLLLNRELKVKWQLWESENRFTSLFYHSIDAHLLISQNGQIFAANDRACRMFEFTPEEIQEVNIDKLLNWFDSGLGYVFEQLQKKGNFTGELIGIKKSGRTFPCGASFSPFEDSENNLYINITLQDISHRKEAEKALRESETRLELAIEGSDGGFWDLKFEPEDSSEGIPDKIYLSPRLKSFIGFKDDEFPNSIESWQSRILPQDLQRLQETARAHLQGEISLHKTKYRIRHKDGSIRWLQTHGKIMRDEGGKPVRWSGLDWDITDIVELQQQLKASEELYRLTLSNISDAVFITDDQGKFTFICPNVDVIFGYSVE